MNLPNWALKNRIFLTVMTVAAIGSGIATFLSMSRREDPEIQLRACVIVANWPGTAAKKMEELVTDALEEAIDQVDEVEKIESDSRVGLSYIRVTLYDTTPNEDQVYDEIRAKVNEVKLPPGCQPAVVNTGFTDVYAVCLGLYQKPGKTPDSRRYTMRELEVYADLIKDEVKALKSVAKVEVHGRQQEMIFVEVDGPDWGQLRITANDLQTLLDERNVLAPGGRIDTEDLSINFEPSGEFTSGNQIANVLAARVEERPVRLEDLTVKVSRRYAEPSHNFVRFTNPGLTFHTPESQIHGKTMDVDPNRDRSKDYKGPQTPALLLAISMKGGSNVVKMGEDIQQVVQQLQSTILPPDLELTICNNIPRQVAESIEVFTSNLWQGILLVLGVAFIIMGWRPAVIMALAIPICMISAIAIAGAMGVELEKMSIAGLIISLGMIVDNAIVISDNVFRLLSEGMSRRKAVIEASHSLAIPILTSTLTTVGVFLPLGMIEGGMGEYIYSMPLLVALTLCLSYLVAMTVTPLLCYWLLQEGQSTTPIEWLSSLFFGSSDDNDQQSSFYDTLVNFCLRQKFLTLFLAIVAFIASLMLVPLIGSQFFPPGYRDQFFVHVWLPEGSSLTKTSHITQRVENLIVETSKDPKTGEERLANAVSFVGAGGPRVFLSSNPEPPVPNYALILINTISPDATVGWMPQLRAEVEKIPGARIEIKPFDLGPSVRNKVGYRLLGPDHKVLRAKGLEMRRVLRDIPGTLNIYSNWGNSSISMDLSVDNDRANLAGVTNTSVARSMEGLLSGALLTYYREDEHQIPIVLRVNSEQRQSFDALPALYVNGRTGKVPLNTIAETKATWAPAVISRRNTLPAVTVGGQVVGGILPNAVALQSEAAIREVVKDLPSSYRLEIGGELEETAKGQERLGGAMLKGLICIILVLVWQFRSLAKPMIILVCLPLALTGSLVGLYITGWPLSFMANLGVISLFGVVINNAIILIDFIESEARAGKDLRVAVQQAGRLRMRPIILTTITTIGGLIPLGFFGGPLFAPMAWAMIFGLLLSTVLTLLIVPTVTVLFVENFGMAIVDNEDEQDGGQAGDDNPEPEPDPDPDPESGDDPEPDPEPAANSVPDHKSEPSSESVAESSPAAESSNSGAAGFEQVAADSPAEQSEAASDAPESESAQDSETEAMNSDEESKSVAQEPIGSESGQDGATQSASAAEASAEAESETKKTTETDANSDSEA